MKGIRVDPEERTVRVEGGCLWGDVDHATHPFGLADAERLHLDHWRRRPDAGRRHRLPVADVRPDDRQPARRGRGAGGRQLGDGERGGERGSVLGGARRRRQLRRRDLVPVPAAPGQHRLRRADVLADGQGGGAAAVLARLHPRRPPRTSTGGSGS